MPNIHRHETTIFRYIKILQTKRNLDKKLSLKAIPINIGINKTCKTTLIFPINYNNQIPKTPSFES